MAIPYEVAQAGCDVLEFAETVKAWVGGLWEEVLKVIDSIPFICRTNNGISVCFIFEKSLTPSPSSAAPITAFPCASFSRHTVPMGSR